MARLRVGLVAGEASGDTLGAGLIQALRRLEPDAEFFGVAGPKMQAAGCEVWEPSESLAVMGLVDVLRDLPRLMRLLARLRRSFIAVRPDVFIGIDAPAALNKDYRSQIDGHSVTRQNGINGWK